MNHTIEHGDIIVGDSTSVIAAMAPGQANCIVTSPPYFGLRDYGCGGQIGRESHLSQYVSRVVKVFRDCRSLLSDEGTLWLNIADSYGRNKSLLGVPQRVATALIDDGWLLRQEIVWQKPNALPESAKDRFSRDHETVYLFTKGPRYFFDQECAREPIQSTREPSRKAKRSGVGHLALRPSGTPYDGNGQTRKLRTVWRIPTTPFRGAHFAVFPLALAARCIEIGCPSGGLVFDPFLGSGTTAIAASTLGRRWSGVELNSEYAQLAMDRISQLDGNPTEAFARVFAGAIAA